MLSIAEFVGTDRPEAGIYRGAAGLYRRLGPMTPRQTPRPARLRTFLPDRSATSQR